MLTQLILFLLREVQTELGTPPQDVVGAARPFLLTSQSTSRSVRSPKLRPMSWAKRAPSNIASASVP